MIGKRKRDVIIAHRDSVEETANVAGAGENVQDAFRKYFEASFEPLPEPVAGATSIPDDNSDSDGDIDDDGSDVLEEETSIKDDASETSEWSGLSEATPSSVVKIFDYAHLDATESNELSTKADKRAFMRAAPPRDPSGLSQTKKSTDTAEDEMEEKTNLKYDLDLQRLLQESHLLEQSKSSSMPGKQRHKATDMRMQSLGSKSSLFKQEKMPVSHLVGIRKKAASNESHRRRHAQENGIVLEKPSTKKRQAPKRDRGVDAPVLGKFRGGTLQLSRADITAIQGPRSSSKRGGRRGRS